MIRLFVWNPDVDEDELNWYGSWFHEENIKKLFFSNGIEIVEELDDKCDGVLGYWVKDERIQKFLNFYPKNKILMEYCASTGSKSIDVLLNNNDVKCIFKHSIVRDFHKFYDNQLIYIPASHAIKIAEEFPELYDRQYFKEKCKIYNKEEIDKFERCIFIGCPVLFTPPYVVKKFLDMAKEEDVSNINRNIDVFCSITLWKNVECLEFINKHRTAIYDNLLKLKNEYNCVVLDETGRLGKTKYYNTFIDSKVSVSPYGIGEYCYRDFESLLAGCETIKPDMSFTKTYPDIYNPKYDAFITLDKCRDFDELRRKIDIGLKRFNDPQRIEKRIEIFNMIKNSYNEEFVVKNMASIIKQAMNK